MQLCHRAEPQVQLEHSHAAGTDAAGGSQAAAGRAACAQAQLGVVLEAVAGDACPLCHREFVSTSPSPLIALPQGGHSCDSELAAWTTAAYAI